MFKLAVDGDIIKVAAHSRPKAIDRIVTSPYPAFPTDLQSQVMVLLALADGVSVMKETIFEGRFKHVDELIAHGCGYSGGSEFRIYPRRSRLMERRWKQRICAQAQRSLLLVWPRKGKPSSSKCIISIAAMTGLRRCSSRLGARISRLHPYRNSTIAP